MLCVRAREGLGDACDTSLPPRHPSVPFLPRVLCLSQSSVTVPSCRCAAVRAVPWWGCVVGCSAAACSRRPPRGPVGDGVVFCHFVVPPPSMRLSPCSPGALGFLVPSPGVGRRDGGSCDAVSSPHCDAEHLSVRTRRTRNYALSV